MLLTLAKWLSHNSPRIPLVSKPRRCKSVVLGVDFLEDRVAPVVGSNFIPAPVLPGGPYDGVVDLRTFPATGGPANGFGTGSLIQPGNGHYILTVEHNNPTATAATAVPGFPQGATLPASVTFNLQRNGIPVDVVVPVPANVPVGVNPPAPANAFVINNPQRGLGSIHDIALWKLVDPVNPQANRLLVAPFGAQQYQLYTQAASELGQPVTIVGYGLTGTGLTGQNSNSSATRRLGANLIDNTPATTLLNQVELIDMPGGGNFQVGWRGSTAATTLTRNSTAANVLAALNSLASPAGTTPISGNVAVQAVPGTPGMWWVQFVNGWAGQSITPGWLTVTNTANPITAATQAGTTVTITTTAAHNFAIGQQVVVAGVAIAGYNGTFTLLATPTPTTFTYTTGAGLGDSAFGTATAVSGPTVVVVAPGAGYPVDINNLALDFDNGRAINDANNVIFGVNHTGVAPVQEVQTITITGNPVAGPASTFRLVFQPTTFGGFAITAANQAGTTVTITTAAAHNFAIGQQVLIAGFTGAAVGYNGTFPIVTTPTATTFTYTTGAGLPAAPGGNASVAGQPVPTAANSQFTAPIRSDASSAAVLAALQALPALAPSQPSSPGPFAIAGATEAGNLVTITTGAPHTLVPGQTVVIAGAGVAGYNGTFQVLGITANTFTYTNPTSGLAAAGAAGTATRASAAITAATEAGNTVTITTAAAHNLAAGQSVVIAGVAVAGYNGTYTILATPTPTTFTYHNPTAGLPNSAGGTVNRAAVPTIQVAGNDGGPWTVTFLNSIGANNLGGSDVGQLMVANNANVIGAHNLQGGVNPQVILATTTQGSSEVGYGSGDSGGPNFIGNLLAGITQAGFEYGSPPSVDAALNNSATFGEIMIGGKVKNYAGAAVAITAATQAGTTVTITTGAVHNFVVGQSVVVAGVGVAGYNGTFTILTIPNATTFTYTTGAGLGNSAGGTASGWITGTIAANVSAANPYHLILDMAYQVVGRTQAANIIDTQGRAVPAGLLPLDPITITASRGGAGNNFLIITVTNDTTPSLSGTYFTGLANTIASLTIRGASNINTIQINGDLGMPVTVNGSTGVVVTTATQVGNTVTITTGAAHNFALGQVVAINGVSDARYNGTFTMLATPTPTTFTYNNPTAGLPNANGGSVSRLGAAITAATETGNTVTITTSAAHNFVVGQQVLIAGVANAGYNGTFTILATPTPTTFTYNNPTAGLPNSNGGTATANNRLIINDTGNSANMTYTVTSAAVQRTGGQTVNYSNFQIASLNTGTADDIVDFTSVHAQTATNVNGGAGNNRLDLNHTANIANQVYTVTANSVTAPGGPIGYSNFQFVTLNTGPGNNGTVNVNSTQPLTTTTVNAGAGDTNSNVGSALDATSTLDGIQGPLTINGQVGGANTLIVNDLAAAAGRTYTLDATTIGWGAATNLTFTLFQNLTLKSGTGAGNTVNVVSSRAGTDTSVNAGVASTAINVTNNGSLVGIAGPVYVTGSGGNNLHVNALAHPQGGVQQVQGVPAFFNPWPFSRITIGGAAPVHYRDVQLRYTLPEVPPLPPGIAFLTTPNPVDPLGQMTLITSNLGDTVVFDLTNPLLTSLTTIDDSKGLATAEMRQGAVQSTQVAFLAATNLSVTGGAFNVVSPLTVANAFVSSGDLTVAASYTLTATSLFNQTGGTSTVQGTFSVAGNAALNGGVSRVSGGAVNVTNAFAQAADNTLDIGLQYPSVKAVTAAGVSLGGRLSLFWLTGFTPSFGQVFTIIDNTGASPVDGNFQGLPNEPDGVTFDMNGWLTHITYRGGDGGNDVVLTIVSSIVGQWANTVDFVSSELNPSPGDFSAAQALAAANTNAYGFMAAAWSPALPDMGVQFITLGFTTPVYANGVTIRETFGNGFVLRVDLLDVNGIPEQIWTGTDPTLPGAPAEFTITFPTRTYLVKSVRIYIDTNRAMNTGEQIDAVMLHGSSTGGGGSAPMGAMGGGSGTLSPFTTTRAVSVRRANLGPFATLSVVGPLQVGSTVTFQFTNPSATGFRYSFDFNNDGDFTDPGEVSDSTTASARHTFTTRGWHMVRGRVRAPDGRFTDFWIRVFVL